MEHFYSLVNQNEPNIDYVNTEVRRDNHNKSVDMVKKGPQNIGHGIYRNIDRQGTYIIEATKRNDLRSGLARRVYE